MSHNKRPFSDIMEHSVHFGEDDHRGKPFRRNVFPERFPGKRESSNKRDFPTYVDQQENNEEYLAWRDGKAERLQRHPHSRAAVADRMDDDDDLVQCRNNVRELQNNVVELSIQMGAMEKKLIEQAEKLEECQTRIEDRDKVEGQDMRFQRLNRDTQMYN